MKTKYIYNLLLVWYDFIGEAIRAASMEEKFEKISNWIESTLQTVVRSPSFQVCPFDFPHEVNKYDCDRFSIGKQKRNFKLGVDLKATIKS